MTTDHTFKLAQRFGVTEEQIVQVLGRDAARNYSLEPCDVDAYVRGEIARIFPGLAESEDRALVIDDLKPKKR